MDMHTLIEKYIGRIKIDYPEDDKIYIDLKQFANEVLEMASHEQKINLPHAQNSLNIEFDYFRRVDYNNANFAKGKNRNFGVVTMAEDVHVVVLRTISKEADCDKPRATHENIRNKAVETAVAFSLEGLKLLHAAITFRLIELQKKK